MATDSRIPDNPPAFPSIAVREVMDDHAPGGYRIERVPDGGMDLRDYFAAKALVGLLSGQTEVACEAISYSEKAAAWSYEFADAMLAERAKGGR